MATEFDRLVRDALLEVEAIGVHNTYERYILPRTKKAVAHTEPNASVYVESVEALKALSKRMRKRAVKRGKTKPESTVAAEASPESLPGTWVECFLCKKWRYLPNVHDPSQICSTWHCAMQSNYASTKEGQSGIPDRAINACDVPQGQLPDANKDDYIYTQFAVGSIVWAKIQGYPAWPAMIYYNEEGRYAEFDPITREVTHYHVVFMDPTRTTISRVPTNKLRKFVSITELDHKRGPRTHNKRLRAAAQEAEDALLLSIEDRIEAYGYEYRKTKPHRHHRKQASNHLNRRRKADKVPVGVNESLSPFAQATSSSRSACTQTVNKAYLMPPKRQQSAAHSNMHGRTRAPRLRKGAPQILIAPTKPVSLDSCAQTETGGETHEAIDIASHASPVKLKKRSRKKKQDPLVQSQPLCPKSANLDSDLSERLAMDLAAPNTIDSPASSCRSPMFLKPVDEEYVEFLQSTDKNPALSTTSESIYNAAMQRNAFTPNKSSIPKSLHHYLQLAFKDLGSYSRIAKSSVPSAKYPFDLSFDQSLEIPRLIKDIPFRSQLLPVTTEE